MGKRFASEGTIKKVMDLSMKLFPNNEVTSTEVNDMWNGLNSTPTELDLNYNYSLDKSNNAVTLQQYIGTDPVVTVKSSYDKDNTTYNTKIASNDDNSDNYMFANNETVESVDFEEGVTVGSNINKMFKNCINLKSVNLSNVDLSGVTSVDGTFSETTNLKEVQVNPVKDIPDTVDKSNMFTDSAISDTIKMVDGIEVGPESELGEYENDLWNYVLDEDNKIIKFNTTPVKDDPFDLVIYGAYEKDGKIYRTQIGRNVKIYRNTGNGTDIKTITIKKGIDWSNKTNFDKFFYGNAALTSIKGLENLDMSNKENFSYMFYNCKSLTSLDLTSWDVSNAIWMESMFEGCTNLKEIKVSRSKWVVNTTTIDNMFKNCGVSEVTYVD